MSSEQADVPKPAEGAPAQELPSRPAKQPKEKGEKLAKEGKSKGGKASLEVGSHVQVDVRIWLTGVSQLPSLPEFIKHRIDIFDKIKARTDAELAGMPRPSQRPSPMRAN